MSPPSVVEVVVIGDGLAHVPVLLGRSGRVELLELEARVHDRLQQVQRPEHVRGDRLVRAMPRLADVSLRAEVEDVRPVVRRVPQLTHEVVDRRAVGEVCEVDLQAAAEVADVVQRAARRCADERVDGRAELDERVGEVRAHEAVGARDEGRATFVDVPEVAAEVVERCACPEGVVRHGPYASASVSKRTDSSGLGSLGAAALTAASLIVVSGFAALVGVIIAREFGRTDETDGFFAAYGVFVVVVTASQAIRVAVLPSLARAREARELAATAAGFATALAVVGAPLVLVALFASDRLAQVLTGDGSEIARDACAKALQWVVPAAVAHLFTGLVASTFAALDDYGDAGPRLRTRQRRRPRVHRHTDGRRRDHRRLEGDGGQRRGGPRRARWWRLRGERDGRRCRRRRRVPPASRCTVAWGCSSQRRLFRCRSSSRTSSRSRSPAGSGSGAVTSFGYAYLAATTLAGITAFSIGLVSSVPLSRIELTPAAVARHVVAAAWVALVIVGAAVGVLALAGADLVEAVLGAAYGDDVGDEVAALIVVFSAWMVAAVGVNVTFPLAFVTDRLRALPWIGAAALAAQVLVAWIGVELFELDGLAFSLALSTLFVLAALLVQLGAAERGLTGIGLAAAVDRRAHGGGVRPAAARGRGHGRRARRPRALRRPRCGRASARPHGVVVVPSRAALARLPPLQARAAAIELDERQAGARAEDAMAGRCHGSVASAAGSGMSCARRVARPPSRTAAGRSRACGARPSGS